MGFQQEKMAKRDLNKKTSKKLKENASSTKLIEKTPEPSSSRKTRGAKRQTELLSPSDESGATSRKRLRKANLSEANILNVIDEEELQKRAAQVDHCLTYVLMKLLTLPNSNKTNLLKQINTGV